MKRRPAQKDTKTINDTKKSLAPLHNLEIAKAFNELADILELQSANPFRVRAYRNAARCIQELPKDIAVMLTEGEELSNLPGIGKDLAQKICNMLETGQLKLLQEQKNKIPGELIDLMNLPGLGPKRVKLLYDKLNIKTFDDVLAAIEQKKLCTIRGFGEKIEARILEGIQSRQTSAPKRLLYRDAELIASRLIDFLRTSSSAGHIEIAGSFRRRKETIGDFDILATTEEPKGIIERFIHYDEVSKVLSKGTTRSTVVLKSGSQVDLRVVPSKSYGAALLYFTGSKSHNIKLRTMAIKKGFLINEYGIFKRKRQIGGRTEEEVYHKVSIPYIEPELREDRGELDTKALPHLVELTDIRGDLHVHTNRTDGRASLEQMVEAARTKRYEYIAITDHTKHITVAKGMNAKEVLEQIKEIERMNSEHNNILILKSAEVDILENGKLDLPDEVLRELDFTVCSVHFKFNLSLEKQTERIIRAMDNPHFNILGHPTGRLINQRPPYQVDIEKLMRAAVDRKCFMEINAQPDRLDLNDVYCRRAKELGLRLALSTDAHSVLGMDNIRFGIFQARRGWLEKEDVLNTQSWQDLKILFRRS